MIKVKVDTLFQGQVGIRDKYLRESQETGQDILIIHGQEQMLIPFVTAHKYKAISAQQFRDKYSKESHYLLYYLWKPTIIQEKLI